MKTTRAFRAVSSHRPEALDAVERQQRQIQQAIEVLQNAVNEMTSTIDPENCGWGDVCTYAKAADSAKRLCEDHPGEFTDFGDDVSFADDISRKATA